MLAAALQMEESEPVRQCALTRVRRPASELIRFCLDPEGRVVPDLKNCLPGRGVWLTAERSAVAEAAKKGIFSRGFSAAARADANLADIVDALLEKAALARLSLANKAGLVTSGFTKVCEALDRGDAVLLLHAADASSSGCQKLDGKAAKARVVTVHCLNSGQLSLALGRSNVVHAALREGGACESFLRAVARLDRYRTQGAALKAASEPVTDTE